MTLLLMYAIYLFYLSEMSLDIYFKPTFLSPLQRILKCQHPTTMDSLKLSEFVYY